MKINSNLLLVEGIQKFWLNHQCSYLNAMTILAGPQMFPMLLTNTSNTLGPTYWLSILNPMLGCSHPKHYHQLPGTTTPKTVFKCAQHAGPSGESICTFLYWPQQTNKQNSYQNHKGIHVVYMSLGQIFLASAGQIRIQYRTMIFSKYFAYRVRIQNCDQ